MVSICLLTIDRFDIAEECIGKTLERVGYPYELLCVDNGSTDRRIIEYVASLNPVYHRLNETNEGVARMRNQMTLRARGEYICHIDNDLSMPDGWLEKLVIANKAIARSGVSGIRLHGVTADAERFENGALIWPTLHPMGCRFWNRRFLELVGYFDEEFHPYAYEDIALHIRSDKAGLINYYAAQGSDQRSHEPLDSEYSKAKAAAVQRLDKAFSKRVADVHKGLFHTPAPDMI